jgi:hypothetical protein
LVIIPDTPYNTITANYLPKSAGALSKFHIVPGTMLVVHPNSTCDVCLENYSSGAQSPHTITCGHVFCHGYVVYFVIRHHPLKRPPPYSCIDSLPKPICPLCRTRFESEDIRKLHIDRGQTPHIPLLPFDESSESDEDDEISQEARTYQTDITRIVKEGAPASELRALIDRCHIWLKSQPHNQVTMPIFLPLCL